MSRLIFEIRCPACRGTGVRSPDRAGDWPTPCPCEARSSFSQYQLGRILEESPKAIERLATLRTRADVSRRILGKLCATFGWMWEEAPQALVAPATR